MRTTADVVVIGGGIEGASIAYHLATMGIKNLVLLEKNQLASGSTGKSCGIVRTHYSHDVLIRLAQKSTEAFERMEDEIGGHPGFVQNGFVFMATEEDAQATAEITGMQERAGVEIEKLSFPSLEELLPDVTADGCVLATYERRGGFADPYGVTTAYAAAARSRGAEIREGVAATGIELSGGAIERVLTAEGAIETRTVVNAAGPWAAHVGGMAGVDLPLIPVRNQEVALAPHLPYPTSKPTVFDMDTTVYLRPESGNLVIVGAASGADYCEDPDNYNEKADPPVIEDTSERVCRLLREGEQARFVRGWSGVITVTPDFNPILGRVPGVDGLIVAVGFSGHGFKIAPAVGQCIAEMIVDGKSSAVDISPLAFDRFEKGNQLLSKYVRMPIA
jgi:sarcosine oxidase subunit beta